MNPPLFPKELFTPRRLTLVAVPTVALTLLAGLYAVLQRPTWSATQALMVRDEIVGSARPGRFESTDAMQTAQETILEVALHDAVVGAALKSAGPTPGRRSYDEGDKRAWPTPLEVSRYKSNIVISAPNGAKFGRTEMIYATVKDGSQERARQVTAALCDKLEDRMRQLRDDKHASIIAELDRAIELGEDELRNVSLRMQDIESELGSDVSQLRVLMDGGMGDGTLARSQGQLEIELRTAKAQLTDMLEQRRFFQEALSDPERLISSPTTLLDSQPSLSRLRQSVVDAQVRHAQLQGRMSDEHPAVAAAAFAEKKLKDQLVHELKVAIGRLESTTQSASEQVTKLQNELDGVDDRFDGVVGLRTEYSNLVAERQERSAFLQKARQDMATARANQQAARAVSLITRIENPVPSPRPVGLSKRTIVMGGMVGGFATGLGLVFVLAPIQINVGSRRRWSDFLPQGRRTSDQDLRPQDRTRPASKAPSEGGNRQPSRAAYPPMANGEGASALDEIARKGIVERRFNDRRDASDRRTEQPLFPSITTINDPTSPQPQE